MTNTHPASTAPVADDTSPLRSKPSHPYREGLVSHWRPTERQRLALQERLMDPHTIRLLRPRIGTASRCLELGAGAGSVARWLAQHCPRGHVTATDIDLDFLDHPLPANLRVLRHDVVSETFPRGEFDLIHARALLVHLPERDSVLHKAATWLAPGGWLVVEEPCAFASDPSPYPEFARLIAAFRDGMEARHVAGTRWARRLPALLAQSGLVNIAIEVSPQYVGHGDTWQKYWRLFIEQTASALLDTGLLTHAELHAGLALFDTPGFVDIAGAFIAAWAQRPHLQPAPTTGDTARISAVEPTTSQQEE